MTENPIPVPPPFGLVRRKDLERALGVAPSTLSRMIARGDIPAPVHFTPTLVGWRHDDLVEWIRTRPTASAK